MTKRTGAASSSGVTILGLGNWGSSLASALSDAGTPPREVVVGLDRARPLVRIPGAARGLPLTTLEHARLDAAILWLCVPDSAIAEVAQRVAERARQLAGGREPLGGRIVAHSSGALRAGILRPAAAAGASIASVHPVMTFPTHTPIPLAGVFFGIEAEAAARRKLYALIRRLGGRPFAIAGSGKALYHAVGMLSSPLLVSLIAAAEETAALAGLAPRQARRLIESIATATLRNIFSQGLPHSFSGPIARGDVEAIHLHLEALAAHPMVADVYRSLALNALSALPARNREEFRHALRRSNSKTPKAPGRRRATSSSSGRVRD